MTAEPPVPAAARPRASMDATRSTFLFTDVEGSARLWEEHPEAMGASLETHDGLLRDAVALDEGPEDDTYLARL